MIMTCVDEGLCFCMFYLALPAGHIFVLSDSFLLRFGIQGCIRQAEDKEKGVRQKQMCALQYEIIFCVQLEMYQLRVPLKCGVVFKS